MATPTQENRLVSIATPLGDNVLLVRRCTVREQMSRLFEIDLELYSTKSDLAFDDIIAQNVTLRVELPDGSERFYNGHVCRFTQTSAERGFSRYRAVVVPWLWFLTRTSDCKIFQQSMAEPPDEMTVPGIIKKVFKDLGFEDFRDDGLSETYRTWDFCVQYRETAFNFVSRLMEQEGITYFFEHEDGKHTLVLADSINAHQPFPGYDKVPYHPLTQGSTDKEAITDWVIEHEVQPGTYALNDFNFETPKQSLQQGLVVTSTVSRTHEKSDFEIYDYPGEFLEHGEGESVAKLRIQELQARHETLHGQSTALGFSAGFTFELTDHLRADQNRQYLVTNVTYEFDNGEFSTSGGSAVESHFNCSLKAMDASVPFRPSRITPKPIVHGVQTAIVVGPSGEEIHTDEHGRVKVHFHWDRHDEGNENSSCWIRVSQYWAGKQWGSIHIPRIGQEVIVEFLEGDPDRPIITGRVYNAEQVVPYELPANKTQSGHKSRSSKGGSDANFNEIRFEDKKGEEEVYIHAEKDKKVIVENDRTEEVGHDESIKIGNDRTESVTANEKISIGKNRTEDVGGDESISISGNRTESVDKDERITIAGSRTTDITKSETINVSDTRTETVEKDETLTLNKNRKVTIKENDEQNIGKKFAMIAGDQIQFQTGDASITLKKDGTIEIKGKDIKITGSGKVNIKADSDVVIKGSTVKTN